MRIAAIAGCLVAFCAAVPCMAGECNDVCSNCSMDPCFVQAPTSAEVFMESVLEALTLGGTVSWGEDGSAAIMCGSPVEVPSDRPRSGSASDRP